MTLPTWVLLIILWAPLVALAAAVGAWAVRETLDMRSMRAHRQTRRALGRAARHNRRRTT